MNVIRVSSVCFLFKNYVSYLQNLPPERLLPYAYHLYMALLSGGHIIRKMLTKAFDLKKGSNEGVQVT